MRSRSIPYAIDFVSFLLEKIKKKEQIRKIILFGSVAREEDSTTSDVDVFVDIVKKNSALEMEIRGILDDFLASAKYTSYWEPFGVDNDIKLTIGVLEDWKELHSSIIANGIVLYGKYAPKVKEGKHKVFFVWENVKRVLFNKQLFGHKQYGKEYTGLLQNYGGKRLGKGIIVVSLEHAIVFHKLFKKHKISVKIKKVVEYS